MVEPLARNLKYLLSPYRVLLALLVAALAAFGLLAAGLPLVTVMAVALSFIFLVFGVGYSLVRTSNSVERLYEQMNAIHASNVFVNQRLEALEDQTKLLGTWQTVMEAHRALLAQQTKLLMEGASSLDAWLADEQPPGEGTTQDGHGPAARLARDLALGRQGVQAGLEALLGRIDVILDVQTVHSMDLAEMRQALLQYRAVQEAAGAIQEAAREAAEGAAKAVKEAAQEPVRMREGAPTDGPEGEESEAGR